MTRGVLPLVDESRPFTSSSLDTASACVQAEGVNCSDADLSSGARAL